MKKISKIMLGMALVAMTTMSVAFAQESTELAEDERPPNAQEMHQAILDADYDAFRTAFENKFPLIKVYNDESLFSKLVEAHQLREAGDLDGAKEIMDELGITPPKKRFQRLKQLKENLGEEHVMFKGGQAKAETEE